MTLTIENNLAKESPLTGNLVFYQNMLPPLTSSSTFADAADAAVNGSYKLTVEQAISSADGKIDETTYQNVNAFTVRGPRFSLPGVISSVYPPESASGEYGNVLAHVCLTRATLPWERGTGSAAVADGLGDESDQAPWLGVLLFYETDPAITVKQATLAELTVAGSGNSQVGQLPPNTFYPGFELEYGEQYTDSCLVIDIPIALFNQVAPTFDDLPWLGHVREIQPSNKQSAKYLDKLKMLSTETDKPQLSTVICNRLPITGAQSIACLVSFENWGKYLPGNDGSQNPNLPAGTKTIRMVLMKQWQFFALKQDQTFSGYLLNLNKKNGSYTGSLLQLNPNDGTGEADKAINNAFNMGFVPLDHHTRQGDDTVSWYKGPFVPFDTAGEISIPVNGPDTCTAYNPDTGMFDVSYAAAWQIGRLLALQNGNFATTLYNWKRSNTQMAISAFEEEIIKKTLKEIVDEHEDEPGADAARLAEPEEARLEMAHLMNRSLAKILSQFINNNDGENTTEIKQGQPA